MVSGKPSVVKRGDGHHPAVPPVGVPLFQAVLPAACLRTYAGLFPLPGQLQPVCGTDGLRPASPAAVYAGFQAGKVHRHRFYRLNPVESVP